MMVGGSLSPRIHVAAERPTKSNKSIQFKNPEILQGTLRLRIISETRREKEATKISEPPGSAQAKIECDDAQKDGKMTRELVCKMR